MVPADDSRWQPATFAERGVAVPCTSPMLAGARLRLADRRSEVVVPHPAGARGVYIVALSALAEFCSPTLHDLRLIERVSGLQPITPSAMRLAARAVAAEGVAGRAAIAAAAAGEARDEQAGQNLAMRLMLSLTRDGECAAGATPEQRAAQAVLKLAGRTGRDADAVHFDIQRLAKLVIACGIGGTPATSRCRMLLDLIGSVARAMVQWADTTGSAFRPACLHVAGAADTVRQAGQHVLHQAQVLVDDPAHCLNAWAATPDSVAASLARPAWLLDGWESLCLTWQTAETDDQKADAVAEACLLLPPMPPEVEPWLGTAPIDLAAFRLRPFTMPRAPVAASHTVATVARNERIRSLAA